MKRLSLLLFGVIVLLNCCELVEQAQEQIIEVSGKVTQEGVTVSGAIVLLLAERSVSDGLSLANGSITDNAGKYIIFDVTPGSYFVLAVSDRNNNLRFDDGTDCFGFYGIDPAAQDFVPDKITVKDSDLKNIDIIALFDTAVNPK